MPVTATIKSLHDLKAYHDLCKERTEQCAEILKQLQGYTPDGFNFTFTIKNAVIANFDIQDKESWFVMSFFLAWHDFYKKELTQVLKLLPDV